MAIIPLLLLLAADRLSDPVQIVRHLGENDRHNREIARQYTYVQRVEERQLDESGRATETESKTLDIMFLYGRRYEKLTAKNDRPLPPKDQAKEDEKLRREADKRQHESDADRQRLIREQQKKSDEFRKLLDEVEKAYDLKLEGMEHWDGRTLYRVSATPRADYRRFFPPYSILSKMKGMMWVDADEFQLVKIEAEVIESFSFGLVIARASPGTRFFYEAKRINGEVWMPQKATIKLDGRIGLFKKVRTDVLMSWKDFRKFQTDSRIVEITADPKP